MVLKEYEIEDPNFGTRTFKWDKDEAGEVGFPKGARLKQRASVEAAPTAEGADPAPVVESQEPGNVQEKSAESQPHQKDVDAAKAAEQPENKARTPENKA
ncbi:hypothetical protein SEA_CELAENA_7 [Microbacterium phage Celaena]|uniref:hypothetical protein n=1 Tax=Microbacterium phage Celaena TaxID=2591214 RepID=UPI001162859C|nr:hypothetical protein QDW17_gp07 [Microbacterium phage Celaena]QDH92386.1 hypothetical protein SEA_CELAENA_7 [Microbacterium phage Celaena]